MRAALIIGSPKGAKSTSDALGTYLLEKLNENGVISSKIYVQQVISSGEGIDTLLRGVEEADVIILASPLYADSHHSGVIRAMEIIHERFENKRHAKKKRMMAISNCGFPESSHNDLSVSMSRRFAQECGFEWAGGLALGGGESIGGRPIDEAGGRVRNVKKSLGLAADALSKEENIPEEAVLLMARPMMPRWVYLLFGNIGWVWRARKQRCREKLNGKPYRDSGAVRSGLTHV